MKEEFLIYNKEFKMLILKVVVILVIPFLFGILGYYFTKDIGFRESFILTLETISFLHSETETGVAFFVQWMLIVFGFIAVWVAIEQLIEFFIEGKFVNFYRMGKKMEKFKNLNNHIIICGGGRVGAKIAEDLISKKRKVIIIEKSETVANYLEKKGYFVILGDALHEDTLREAKIEKASTLVSVLPEPEKNIVIVLAARELNPKLIIYARSDTAEFSKRLKKAGADFVVTPEVSCADEIIKKINV